MEGVLRLAITRGQEGLSRVPVVVGYQHQEYASNQEVI